MVPHRKTNFHSPRRISMWKICTAKSKLTLLANMEGRLIINLARRMVARCGIQIRNKLTVGRLGNRADSTPYHIIIGKPLDNKSDIRKKELTLTIPWRCFRFTLVFSCEFFSRGKYLRFLCLLNFLRCYAFPIVLNKFCVSQY